MSVQAMSWVLDFSESRLGARLVLLAIANHVSNDNGEAWPSIDTIAREARVDETNVRRNIAELVHLGELEIEAGGRGPKDTNTYRLPAFLEWYRRGAKGGEIRGAKGGDLQPKGGETPEKGVQSAPRTVSNHQEPSEEKPDRSLKPSETSSSEERENPEASFRAAKTLFRSICKAQLGYLGEKNGEGWGSAIEQYGHNKVMGALEIWAEELGREGAKKYKNPINLFLSALEEYIEAFETKDSPEEEPKEDQMLTGKDVIREREQRDRESRGE